MELLGVGRVIVTWIGVVICTGVAGRGRGDSSFIPFRPLPLLLIVLLLLLVLVVLLLLLLLVLIELLSSADRWYSHPVASLEEHM